MSFDLKLDNLPSSIKKIEFDEDSEYNKELNCLPAQLSILKLPAKYNIRIQLIPSALTKLICSENYPYHQDFANFASVEIEFL